MPFLWMSTADVGGDDNVVMSLMRGSAALSHERLFSRKYVAAEPAPAAPGCRHHLGANAPKWERSRARGGAWR